MKQMKWAIRIPWRWTLCPTLTHINPLFPVIRLSGLMRSTVFHTRKKYIKINTHTHTHTHNKRRPSNQSWGWEEQRLQTQGLVLSHQPFVYFCRWRRPQGTYLPTLESNMSTARFLLRILSEPKTDKQGNSSHQPLFCSRNPLPLSWLSALLWNPTWLISPDPPPKSYPPGSFSFCSTGIKMVKLTKRKANVPSSLVWG